MFFIPIYFFLVFDLVILKIGNPSVPLVNIYLVCTWQYSSTYPYHSPPTTLSQPSEDLLNIGFITHGYGQLITSLKILATLGTIFWLKNTKGLINSYHWLGEVFLIQIPAGLCLTSKCTKSMIPYAFNFQTWW